MSLLASKETPPASVTDSQTHNARLNSKFIPSILLRSACSILIVPNAHLYIRGTAYSLAKKSILNEE